MEPLGGRLSWVSAERGTSRYTMSFSVNEEADEEADAYEDAVGGVWQEPLADYGEGEGLYTRYIPELAIPERAGRAGTSVKPRDVKLNTTDLRSMGLAAGVKLSKPTFPCHKFRL